MNLDTLVKQFYILSTFLIFSGFILSYFLTKVLTYLAIKYRVVDDPNFAIKRKKQSKAVPLVVGSGFCISACIVSMTVVSMSYFDIFNFNIFINEQNWAVKVFFSSLAVLVLLIGGLFDDLRKLNPIHQGFFVLGSVLLAVLGGKILMFDHAGVELSNFLINISNWLTFHGFLDLNNSLFFIINIFDPTFVNQVLTILWLTACIAATKFLDGHDGLVGSIGLVGFLSIASVALFDYIQQPLLSLFALIWAFSLAGFLPSNFPNAKVYLGEGASYVVGFMIGVLSIMSGSKTLLGLTVIGLFIIDLALVWTLRILQKRNPLTSGDRLHWHHRLDKIGLNKIQVLTITVFITLLTTHLYFWFRDSWGLWLLLVQPAIVLILFLIWILKCGSKEIFRHS